MFVVNPRGKGRVSVDVDTSIRYMESAGTDCVSQTNYHKKCYNNWEPSVIIPRETEGYGVELVRLSVRLSVCLSVCLSVPVGIG